MPSPQSESQPLAPAYAACLALARSHYENFPVASRLLPRSMRAHVAAVYAFARVADDIADEGPDPPDVRRARLQTWQQRLHQAVDRPIDVETGGRDELMLAALAHSIRSLDLPLTLFDDLVSAFAQDITTTRYASWAEVFDYCRRSANPIGRLVLRIAGCEANQVRDESADALCTALQLTNFWQDFGRDWRHGRLYVPREVSDACGANEADLADGRFTSAWADAIGRSVAVTRGLFDRGRHVCDMVAGRLRFELRVTWLGGRSILDRVVSPSFDSLNERPVIGRAEVVTLLWRAARWGTDA